MTLTNPGRIIYEDLEKNRRKSVLVIAVRLVLDLIGEPESSPAKGELAPRFFEGNGTSSFLLIHQLLFMPIDLAHKDKVPSICWGYTNDQEIQGA